MLNTVSRLALASAIGLAGASSAFALDPQDFGDKLAAASKIMGIAFSFADASAEGDTVTLSDFTIRVPGEDAIELPGDVVFEGVVEAGDGSYTARTATIADIVFEEDDMTLNFSNILAEGIVVPATATLDNALDISFTLYDRVSAGPLTISKDDTRIFSFDSVAVWIDELNAEGGLGTGYELVGLSGDLTAIPEDEAQEFITAFGIEEISGEMAGYGMWYPETGLIDLSEGRLTLDNLGSINVTAAASGYTTALYREMMKINLKMAEMAASGAELSDEQMETLEQAMMSQFATLKLDSATIRYDDASLFMKTLDFIAAEQGVDGATFASGLKFMVPMLLTEVQDAQFKSMVTSAVNAFIDSPQNFEIAAEPDAPVGMEDFMTAEEDPLALIDILNLQVRANQ